MSSDFEFKASIIMNQGYTPDSGLKDYNRIAESSLKDSINVK